MLDKPIEMELVEIPDLGKCATCPRQAVDNHYCFDCARRLKDEERDAWYAKKAEIANTLR